MENNYTNFELSRDYYRATPTEVIGYMYRRMIARKIRNTKIDLIKFYKEHNNSLDELRLKGFDKETKSILEEILRNV